jgi:WxL Interacting Protein, peptidoglycan binding domain
MPARRLRSMVAPLLATSAVFLTAALPVLGADPAAKLGLKPVGVPGAYFDLKLGAGETKRLTVELGNYGSAPVTASTFASDAYSMIDGGMAVRLEGEPTSGTTGWLDYAAESLTLKAGATTTRSFTVTIPRDAAPGDHTTSLVVQSEAAIGGAGEVAFNQVLRQVVAVAIHVPGAAQPGLALPSAALRTTPAGLVWLDFAVDNTGRRNLKLSGEYAIHDAAGSELVRKPVSMSTVFAGDPTTLAVPLAVTLAPGRYTTSLCLADPAFDLHVCSATLPLDVANVVAPAASASAPPAGSSIAPAATVDVTAIVIAAVAAGLLLGAVLGLIVWFVVRRRNRHRPELRG